MKFSLEYTDKESNARAGRLLTDHGEIPTPVFMPVGTVGSVKGVYAEHLISEANPPIILGNTYHLYLRPGTSLLQKAGGLHEFIKWDRPMLTDSGGYQVYSLSDIRKLNPEGVEFRSHIDGSKHFFSPENVMDIQRAIGADIMMVLDECTPYPCDYKYAKVSLKLTHDWLARCCRHFDNTHALYSHSQSLFPIVQGSVYSDLRKQSAETIASFEREGNAIGGLSVGEPHEVMYEITDLVCGILPKDKPRYLMGVGTPANLLECIALGIDMFDCVMPTRNGRNGMLFTSEGIINIRNEKWKDDLSPIDPNGNAFIDTKYSRAYLRHLFGVKEMLGPMMASLHNLSFYLWLVREARKMIEEGQFAQWKNSMIPKLQNRL